MVLVKVLYLDDKFVAVTNRETNDKIVIVSEGCEDHGRFRYQNAR